MNRTKAPISAEQRQQLKRDLQNIEATAQRKGISLLPYEQIQETAAGNQHFELGCWLFYFSRKVGLKDGLKHRIDCALKIFEAGMTSVNYQFYTVFDFGARQFDTIFEMGDAQRVVAGLRQHLKDDKTGNLAAAFQSFGWLLTEETKEIEVDKLSSIGKATITSLGSENIYITKDGLPFYAKVYNTEDYVLGEWDFSAHPNGRKLETEFLLQG